LKRAIYFYFDKIGQNKQNHDHDFYRNLLPSTVITHRIGAVTHLSRNIQEGVPSDRYRAIIDRCSFELGCFILKAVRLIVYFTQFEQYRETS
jgi:hypothetical protein